MPDFDTRVPDIDVAGVLSICRLDLSLMVGIGVERRSKSQSISFQFDFKSSGKRALQAGTRTLSHASWAGEAECQ